MAVRGAGTAATAATNRKTGNHGCYRFLVWRRVRWRCFVMNGSHLSDGEKLSLHRGQFSRYNWRAAINRRPVIRRLCFDWRAARNVWMTMAGVLRRR